MKLRLPASAQNWISLIGATIALISLFMIIFLFAITSIFGQSATYLGLVIYILLPGIMVIGLLLIPLGMYLKYRRDLKSVKKVEAGWPRIDLNNPQHRNAFFVFTIGTTVFLFLSALGSYEAFHYTESVQFCGTLCHTIMEPEYVAYQNSPHARVKCVECHVGEGADWYVRSKLSGLYQVYATLARVYPKPIETPIHNLRPARETCEQCHWPQKFYSYKLRLETHYLPDENNSRWDIQLIMKIGAKHPAQGLNEGIHWHINPNTRIEFIASDKKQEVIPWVRYTNLKTGEVTVFQDQDNPLEPGQLDTMQVQVMDCIDCHNRPSHLYRPPSLFINSAITAGDIPQDLPEIKAIALEVCAEEYPTMDSAMVQIRSRILQFYRENYPDIVDTKRDKINKAISGVQSAFAKNIFPEMKVRWNAYPNHIGHLEYTGCFRCHNSTHQSTNGESIRKDCNLCHIISAQGPAGNMEIARVGEALEFKHPEDIDGAWQESLCSDCHTGLNP